MSTPVARPCVLVIDGDLPRLQVFREALRDAGFDADGVVNSGDALRALQTRPYRVILADYQLPDVGGVTLVAALHAARPTAAVIPYSVRVTPDVEAEAHESGAFTVLEKPLPLHHLADTIRRACAAA